MAAGLSALGSSQARLEPDPFYPFSFIFLPQNTHETVKMIKGMRLERAKIFLNNVIEKKEIVAFRRFNYGVGRKAQVRCRRARALLHRSPPTLT